MRKRSCNVAYRLRREGLGSRPSQEDWEEEPPESVPTCGVAIPPEAASKKNAKSAC